MLEVFNDAFRCKTDVCQDQASSWLRTRDIEKRTGGCVNKKQTNQATRVFKFRELKTRARVCAVCLLKHFSCTAVWSVAKKEITSLSEMAVVASVV